MTYRGEVKLVFACSGFPLCNNVATVTGLKRKQARLAGHYDIGYCSQLASTPACTADLRACLTRSTARMQLKQQPGADRG
jgi:hypothetical protein